MNKNYIKFVRGIYSYCDENVGEKVLFPFFMNYWPEIDCKIQKKDLAFLTSKIANRLVSRKVLKEVEKDFENVYGMYKILRH